MGIQITRMELMELQEPFISTTQNQKLGNEKMYLTYENGKLTFSLKEPQFYIQLVYKPHFLKMLRAVRKKINLSFSQILLRVFFPLFMIKILNIVALLNRECVRNLNLWVQVRPGELWVSKQRVHIVLEASKSAGAKGGVPKICGFVHPLHPF